MSDTRYVYSEDGKRLDIYRAFGDRELLALTIASENEDRLDENPVSVDFEKGIIKNLPIGKVTFHASLEVQNLRIHQKKERVRKAQWKREKQRRTF